jgi:hypothetical protein
VPHTTETADPRSADQLREAMTDGLIAEGWVTSPHVEAAFRAVPRHLFTPAGTPLETSYDGHAAPVLKKAPDGSNLSSVSGPWLQALMIAQAGIGPGMRVMEIGSGGYNAALLAEVTGEHVVTVDIDPDITARDLPDGGGVEFGAYAYGDRAEEATATLIRHLHAWDARGRDLPEDAFMYWPDGTTPPLPDELLSIFGKRHGTATITWPAQRTARTPAKNPGPPQPAPDSRASATSAGA